jgi:hypothetical protein
MSSEDETPDDVIFQHLGAAVLLCWHQLPRLVQVQILAQAEDMIGLPHVPGIQDKIVELALRLAPRI